MEVDIHFIESEIPNNVLISSHVYDSVSRVSQDSSEVIIAKETTMKSKFEKNVNEIIESEESNKETLIVESEKQKSCTQNDNLFLNVDDDVSNSRELVGCQVQEIDNRMNETLVAGENPSNLRYEWKIRPKLLCSATEEYKPNETYENFTKGCQWSPDGTCLLVTSEDLRLRIYELPQEFYSGKTSVNFKLSKLKPALTIKEGGLIYDCCWYPYMNSWDPATCCFLATSRETPVHLWDAFTGELRATYRAYNQFDEVEPAISIGFINSGREIWSGFRGSIKIFDTDRPGRQTETITLKKDFPYLSGLVSCIRENPSMPGLVAFGTYSKYIGLYQNGPICSFQTGNGVTQIEFSPCGTKLYSAVRRSNEFLCWDLRNPGVVLWSLENRKADTNQRIQFQISLEGSTIVSGGTDGYVKIWQINDYQETESEAEELYPISKIQLSKDCINGVSLHMRLPILALSSGQRICDEDEAHRDNAARLWWFGNDKNN